MPPGTWKDNDEEMKRARASLEMKICWMRSSLEKRSLSGPWHKSMNTILTGRSLPSMWRPGLIPKMRQELRVFFPERLGDRFSKIIDLEIKYHLGIF